MSSAPASMPAATSSKVSRSAGFGEDDDRHVLVGRVGADPPAGVHDVARRGPDAHQDGLRLAHDDGRDGCIAMADRPHVVARLLERRRQRRMATRLILDHEDQSTGGFGGQHVLVRWPGTGGGFKPYEGPECRLRDVLRTGWIALKSKDDCRVLAPVVGGRYAGLQQRV